MSISPRPTCLLGYLAFAAISFCRLASTYAALPETVDFNFHIRPILSDRCYACHGPDAENREADLRLDDEEAAFAALDSGEASHVIKPGEPKQSEVYLRIATSDEDLRMPPADSNLSLSPEEIQLIRKWIEQGAEWKPHWSFMSLEDVAAPTTNNTEWPNNEIDRFVLSHLKEENLQPAAEASHEKLIRRVTYDLTGLPPTLEEIDAFISDQSTEAYEKLVDRLLDSPRFGERLAVEWLDVARYADTYGYQSDVYRAVWPWRDWVVESFNQNMPYDEFITWQLAGDLLPEANKSQILATAFNRLHRQTNEGGSIEEEFRVEYVADRTETFGTAFLGLTFQCARCHDHKYDPLTQKDYYQLFGFFGNIDESGLYSHYTSSVPTPTLFLSEDEQDAQLEQLAQKVAEAEAQLQSVAEEQQSNFEAWLSTSTSQPEIAGLIGDFSMDSIEEGQIANRVNPEQPGKVDDDPQIVEGKINNGLHLSGENNFSTKVGGTFTRHNPFSVGLWINTPDEKDRAVIWHRTRSWTDAGSRGYQLLFDNGKLSASLIHFWPGNAIRVVTDRMMPTNQWLRVFVTYDGSSRANGLKIYVDGKLEKSTVIRNSLTKTIGYNSDDNNFTTFYIGQRNRDRGFKNGLVDELKIYDRMLTSAEVKHEFNGKALGNAFANADKSATLLDYYLHNFSEPYQKALATLKAARTEHGKLLDSIEEIMVMRELPEPRPSHILNRGVYDAPGEKVAYNTPASLPAMADGLPKNRLGLARWLTDPAHPLTARVTVNRYWQMLFGRGLVGTPEDFGSQGELPTHPQLLDWLAKSFIDSGWDVKLLLKRIVMSATYRQTDLCSPELRAQDPANTLLARGPYSRLPAEMLRDGALFTSDLLVEKLGGPPVKPYQPAGLWKEKGSSTFQRDEGEGSHRRSLYTHWKRTSPPPSMLTLDAAKRDVCAVQRQSTATPLQALVLLNDPQYVEAARALAELAIKQTELSTEQQLADLFRRLTGRAANQQEIELLSGAFADQFKYFEAEPDSAKEFLSVGDHAIDENLNPSQLAAMSMVAETIMNLEEAVTK